MPGITGQGTTYNLPNYTGELFGITPADTPFLSAIGGLSGGKSVKATEWEWQAYDLRDPAIRARLEGADAPSAEERTRFNLSNVVQIAQEKVEVSYTKLAATGAHAGVNTDASNPVTDELAWQTMQALKTKAMDTELAFLSGRYVKPSDNTTARKTRGLIEAIETGIQGITNVKSMASTTLTAVALTISNNRFTKNTHGLANDTAVVVEGGEPAGFVEGKTYYVVGQSTNYFSLALTVGGAAIVPLADVASVSVLVPETADSEDVLDLIQTIWENGGLREDEGRTAIVGAGMKRLLTNEFVTGKGYDEQTRNVGGVDLQTIETDFGRLSLMLSRIVPRSSLVIASIEQCQPVFLEIPGKGHLFLEDLAKTGAAEKKQLYGEIGLEYGNPIAHGELKAVKV